jgi:hypothetical protein
MDNIEEIIANIKNKTYTRDNIEINHPQFFTVYPVFGKKVFEPDFDWKLLDVLMSSKSKVDSMDMNLNDASEEFGGVLVDKYIKPVLHES